MILCLNDFSLILNFFVTDPCLYMQKLFNKL
jgi:hypothetical protein